MNPEQQLIHTMEQAQALKEQFSKGKASEDDVVELFTVLIAIVQKIADEVRSEMSDADEQTMKECESKIEGLDIAQDRLGRLLVTFRDDSKKGLDDLAREVFDEISKVKDLIPSVKDWSHLEQQIKEVEGKIPTVPEELSNEQLRDKLESLEGDSRTDKSAIKGIEEIEEKIKQIELRPIGVRNGVARGFQLYVDGTKQGMVNMINLVAGNNVSLTYNRANGRNDITINATGGSGTFSVLAVTGTVDDSNVNFTTATAAVIVVVNGASYRDGHGCTISGTNITLDNPVGQGGDIYAISG